VAHLFRSSVDRFGSNGTFNYHILTAHPNRHLQSSRIEILNEGGFRSDGRRQYELRGITFDSTAQAGADGSARITHGLTEVLVSVFGPREARVRAQTLHDRATIHVEATIAPFSANDRRRRGRGDKCVQSQKKKNLIFMFVIN
jgi:ribonuclease PH